MTVMQVPHAGKPMMHLYGCETLVERGLHTVCAPA